MSKLFFLHPRGLWLGLCILPFASLLGQQNVGIGPGVATPTRARLEVPSVPSGSSTGAIFGSGVSGISLQRSWPTIGFNQYRDDIFSSTYGKYMATGPAATIAFNHNTGYMYFDVYPAGTANAEITTLSRVMTIGPTGNVGFRNTTPDASLSVARGNNLAGSLILNGDSTQTIFHETAAETVSISANTPTKTLFISQTTGGDVLIGGTLNRVSINRPNVAPLATIDLFQNLSANGGPTAALRQTDNSKNSWSQRVLYSFIENQNNLWFLHNDTNKLHIKSSNGLMYQASDARMKTHIQNLGPVLERVRQLQPVRYRMKGGSEGGDHIGFIAQEVVPHFPWLVRVIDNNQKQNRLTNLHALDYSGFGVVAIKALQEQWQQIKQLEQEQAELLKRLDALEQ